MSIVPPKLPCSIGALGNCRRRKTGFTLVELLVVIGIIAVLISILLPSLAKARQAAITIACASNLKQFGLQYQMYANGNNGWMPPTGWGVLTGWLPVERDRRSWIMMIAKDMGTDISQDGSLDPTGQNVWGGQVWKNFGIWRCPANTAQEMVASPWCPGSVDEIGCSYTVNSFDTSIYDQGMLVWGMGGTDASGGKDKEGRFLAMKQSMFQGPAELYAMWDSINAISMSWTTPWDDSLSMPSPNPYPGVGVGYMRYVHNGGFNMLFADGHVEWMKGPLKSRGDQIAGTPAEPHNNHASFYTNGKGWYARN